MSQFTRTRVRCEVYPNKVGEAFKSRFTAGNPKIYKGGGCDFEIALLNDDGTLFDVSNVTEISILVRDGTSLATLMAKTSAQINQTLTIDDWNNGIGAHAVVSFTGAEASIAAAVNHKITVHGVTSDAGADPDVFGTSVLEVIDAGITGITNPVIDPATGVTFETLTNLLAGYVTFLLPPGKTLTYQSDDGKVKRIEGVANSNPTGDPAGERIDKLEFEN